MAEPTPTPTPTPSPSLDPGDLADTAENFIDKVVDVNWWFDELLQPAIQALIIVVILLVIRFLLYRAVDRYVKRIEAGVEKETRETGEEKQRAMSLTARVVIGDDPIALRRRTQRAETIGSLAKTIIGVVIWTMLVLMVLGQFGFNLTPLIAGAGIVGVALGFGAQSLVQDFLSGVFMLMEDQYGLGDIIDMGEASGTVEDVSLRVTSLRAVDGVVWHVRNGEVVRVGNMSQGWSRALLDVGVGYGEDVGKVRNVLTEVAHAMSEESGWRDKFLEEPSVLGIQDLAADSVVVRMTIKTTPGDQWEIARELRQRIKHRFDAEGIEIPFPQRTVWMRTPKD